MSEHNEDIGVITKPIEELDDKKALLRATADYAQAKSDKSTALVRARRYDHIFQTLDSPDEDIDESTGRIEDDESIYANTYMPIGAAIVESAVAQLFNLIFSTPDYIKIESDDIEDMLFETLITEHLKKRHREFGFKNKVLDALRQACCFDYCVTGTRWLMKGGFQVRPKRTIETIEIGGIKLKKQTVKAVPQWIPDKIDRSDMFVLNFFHCYHDDDSIDGLNDSRFFCDDRFVPLQDLVADSETNGPWGRYKNIDKLIASVKVDPGYQAAIADVNDPELRQTILSSRRIKITRYSTQHHILEFSQNHVIRRKNTYDWYLQLWKIFDHARPKFPGMGFLQRLERNQLDINASLNSRRNLQNLISNPFAIIDQELFGDRAGTPRIYPGWVGTFSSGVARDKIYIYTPGGNTNQDSMVDVQMQIDISQKMSAIDENAFGTVTGDRTTATEVRNARSGRITRLGTVGQKIEEQCLEKIYLNQFFLEMTYLDHEEKIRYFGEHGDVISSIDMSAYMWNSVPQFTAMGTFSMLDDAVKMNQFFVAVDLALKLPQVRHNWQNIALEIWRTLHPKEYHKFVEDPNIPDHNIPPEIENMLMSQGKKVEVSPLNNHAQHKQVHEALKLTPDYQIWPQGRKLILDTHLQETDAALVQATPGNIGGFQDEADSFRGVRPTSIREAV